MSAPQPPVFGKRNGPRAVPPRPVRAGPAVLPVAADHAAFFAAARAELAETRDAPARVVPRSMRAAMLAGLSVGCGLAGLDIMRAHETLGGLTGMTLDATMTTRMLPAVILLGLVGGARAAAMNLLVAHWALRRMEATHPLAYAAAGALVGGFVSALFMTLVQNGLVDASRLPTHGPQVDILAGAAAGLLYRSFAGARPV